MSGAPFGNGRSPDATSARGRRVLVTGAAGFIGSHLCDRLLDDGYQVWGLDSFEDSYDPARKRKNLADALEHPSMHLVEGDVRDRVLLDGLMSDVKFDVVVHLAARSGGLASLGNPLPTCEINIVGTLALLEGVRRHSVPALLFASSASVYGASVESPRREDATADRPLTPYAASKRAGEMLCHTYHHQHGLTVHCLRFSPVFGPRQRPDLGIHELAHHLLDGNPRRLGGDGLESRDLLYVDDAVNGIVLSLERTRSRNDEDPEYQVINVGGSEAVGETELVKKLSQAMGIPSEPAPQPSGASESEKSEEAPPPPSTEKAAELLGYRPSVGVEEGIAEFIGWFRESQAREDERTARDSVPRSGTG